MVEVPVPGRLAQYRTYLSNEINVLTRAESQRTAYAKKLQFVNCGSRTILTSMTVHYTANGGVVKSDDASYGSGERVVPGSIGEAVLDAICAGPLTYDHSIPPPPPPAGPSHVAVSLSYLPDSFDYDVLPSWSGGYDVQYPAEYRQPRLVFVKAAFVVDAAGNVVNPRVLESNDSRYNASVLTPLRTWKYQPARRNGVAVAVAMTVVYLFRPD